MWTVLLMDDHYCVGLLWFCRWFPNCFGSFWTTISSRGSWAGGGEVCASRPLPLLPDSFSLWLNSPFVCKGTGSVSDSCSLKLYLISFLSLSYTFIDCLFACLKKYSSSGSGLKKTKAYFQVAKTGFLPIVTGAPSFVKSSV